MSSATPSALILYFLLLIEFFIRFTLWIADFVIKDSPFTLTDYLECL